MQSWGSGIDQDLSQSLRLVQWDGEDQDDQEDQDPLAHRSRLRAEKCTVLDVGSVATVANWLC